MTELHEVDVDGVRTFWVDTGRPTLAAMLMFRHGMVDEQFTTHGWTHLLEHLCLHGRGGGPLAVNGSVSLLATTFTAHGPAADVVGHLAHVASWLADPDLAHLDHERKVLQAESGVRAAGDLHGALVWRYGARGPGLVAHDEHGLALATPDSLAGLAARVFTRGNAVLVLDGPPPPALRLHLPDGAPQPVPEAVPCDDRRPASYPVGRGLVLSGQVTRSAAATLVPAWLERELRHDLRDRAGAAYAPWSGYEPVDSGHAVVVGGSDVSVEHEPALARSTLDLVRRLEAGPAPDTLADLVAGYVQSLNDPYQAVGLAVRAGHAALRGERPQTLAELLAEARSWQPEQLAEVGRELSASLLVGLPPGAGESTGLPRIAQPSDAYSRTTGTVYRSANSPLDTSVLVVEPAAIRVVGPQRPGAVSVDRLVGVLQVPDGARRLVEADGWTVEVEPTLWRRGHRAVAQIDALVPADLLVPQPARDPGAVPQPASFLTRHRPRLVAAGVVTGATLAIGTVLVLCIVFVPKLAPALGIAMTAYLVDRRSD